MQRLKLLPSLLLVTVCTIYVHGVPVYNKYMRPPDKSPQHLSKGNFAYMKKNPEVSKSPSVRGATSKPVSATVNRGAIDMSPQHLSRGYFAYFNNTGTNTGSPKSTGSPQKTGTREISSAPEDDGGSGTGVAGVLGSVGGGIASGVGGIASGVGGIISGGAQSISSVTNVLSSAIPESVTGILSNTILGIDSPGMNIDTGLAVLEKVGGFVPGVGPSIQAAKTVSHVIKKIKSIQNENGAIDPTKLMLEAADSYFTDVDPNLKRKLVDMGPLAVKAASGDAGAAKQIAASLVDPNLMLEAVKNVGFKSQIDLLQNVVGQAKGYANMAQTAGNVAQMVMGK